MKVFYNLEEIENMEETAIALGNFDGIHKGHQALINKAVEVAKEKNLKSAVFTFTNHPGNVMAGSCVVKNLVYQDMKIKLLEDAGIDYLFSIDFSNYIMSRPPKEFIDDILIAKFNIKEAICGFNYTYGYKAAGTSATLAEYAKQKNVGVNVIDAVMDEGQVVSSTLIRNLIAEGNVERVTRLMGRPYMMRGKIIHGNNLGGPVLGFPTCNIIPDEQMAVPHRGAYAAEAVIDGERYFGMANVGKKPTVGSDEVSVETHIFDFDQDVYGKDIEVYFIKLLRDEKKFDGLEALKAQLEYDKSTCRKYFGI